MVTGYFDELLHRVRRYRRSKQVLVEAIVIVALGGRVSLLLRWLDCWQATRTIMLRRPILDDDFVIRVCNVEVLTQMHVTRCVEGVGLLHQRLASMNLETEQVGVVNHRFLPPFDSFYHDWILAYEILLLREEELLLR